ncbi:MAG: prepilin-type N-terminal cleavage/methylation domain-containing protein [Phycisphaerales bacterium]|nr:prepilin-type N-terminal cleavage/methylation domain-containing protein [Phycisphaerales bacterium]
MKFRGHGMPERHTGFTMVELMVVVACVSIMLTLLVPSLSAARSAVYRVVSAGHQRTIGQGLVMFTGGSNGRLPPSRVLLEDPLDLAELQRVYKPTFSFDGEGGYVKTAQLTPGDWYRHAHAIDSAQWGWDGLGHLYFGSFVPDPAVFYSPSHSGDHPYELYADSFIHRDSGLLPADHTIYSNYHFIGHLNEDGSEIRIEQDSSRVLVCDGLRTRSDLNHREGLNLLYADGSVHWLFCSPLASVLPAQPRGMDDPPKGRHNELIRSIFDGNFEEELGKQRRLNPDG